MSLAEYVDIQKHGGPTQSRPLNLMIIASSALSHIDKQKEIETREKVRKALKDNLLETVTRDSTADEKSDIDVDAMLQDDDMSKSKKVELMRDLLEDQQRTQARVTEDILDLTNTLKRRAINAREVLDLDKEV